MRAAIQSVSHGPGTSRENISTNLNTNTVSAIAIRIIDKTNMLCIYLFFVCVCVLFSFKKGCFVLVQGSYVGQMMENEEM